MIMWNGPCVVWRPIRTVVSLECRSRSAVHKVQTLGVAFVDSPAHSVTAVLVMVEREAVLDDILQKKRRRDIRI